MSTKESRWWRNRRPPSTSIRRACAGLRPPSTARLEHACAEPPDLSTRALDPAHAEPPGLSTHACLRWTPPTLNRPAWARMRDCAGPRPAWARMRVCAGPRPLWIAKLVQRMRGWAVPMMSGVVSKKLLLAKLVFVPLATTGKWSNEMLIVASRKYNLIMCNFYDY